MSSKEQVGVGIVERQTRKLELGPDGFKLKNGGSLPELDVAFETYGTLTAEKDNVIYICHALTGDAHVAGRNDPSEDKPGWWDEMVGPGKGIDTNYYFVVCANILGGCTGTTGPSSTNPATGKQYGSAFPEITVSDIVDVQKLLLQSLGVDRLAAVIGGSFGGMQVLEWGIRYPDKVDRCISIASAASLSTQALAFDVVGRDAIVTDPGWHGGDYYDSEKGPSWGLAHARKIGHITYLSPEIMQKKFGREKTEASSTHSFQVESYLDYQGNKLVERFDPNSYLQITKAMDSYDLAEECGSLENAVKGVESKFLIVALSSDWLFPPEQSEELANALLSAGKEVSCCTLDAPYGHDAFLIDIQHLSDLIRAFLPWVKEHSDSTAVLAKECDCRDSRLCEEYGIIAGAVTEGARVLDFGCGNGDLLSVLASRKNTAGLGVDIDLSNIIDVIDKGHDVFQADVDRGLPGIPDQSYDLAIASETLQVVRKPRFLLSEMLRVAKEAIVSFPNFGTLSHRLDIGVSGRMPKGGALPFEWYDTPNIHLFTLRDFRQLCNEDGIEIRAIRCMANAGLSSLLVKWRFCNMGAERVIVRIARGDGTDNDSVRCS